MWKKFFIQFLQLFNCFGVNEPIFGYKGNYLQANLICLKMSVLENKLLISPVVSLVTRRSRLESQSSGFESQLEQFFSQLFSVLFTTESFSEICQPLRVFLKFQKIVSNYFWTKNIYSNHERGIIKFITRKFKITVSTGSCSMNRK